MWGTVQRHCLTWLPSLSSTRLRLLGAILSISSPYLRGNALTRRRRSMVRQPTRQASVGKRGEMRFIKAVDVRKRSVERQCHVTLSRIRTSHGDDEPLKLDLRAIQACCALGCGTVVVVSSTHLREEESRRSSGKRENSTRPKPRPPGA